MKVDACVALAAAKAKVPDVVAQRVVEEYLSALKAAVEYHGAYVVEDFLTVEVRHSKGDRVRVRARGEWRTP